MIHPDECAINEEEQSVKTVSTIALDYNWEALKEAHDARYRTEEESDAIMKDRKRKLNSKIRIKEMLKYLDDVMEEI